MCEDSNQLTRKDKSVVKHISTWLGVIVLLGSLVMGFAKSFYQTPMKMEEHDKRIERLEAAAEALKARLQEQRELLIEIRGDVKAMGRINNRNQN